MIKYENHCRGCDVPGYPCIGDSCPYSNVKVYYCDICNIGNYAKYEMDGEHYCDECIKEYLKETFEEMSVIEQADILKILVKTLED